MPLSARLSSSGLPGSKSFAGRVSAKSYIRGRFRYRHIRKWRGRRGKPYHRRSWRAYLRLLLFTTVERRQLRHLSRQFRKFVVLQQHKRYTLQQVLERYGRGISRRSRKGYY
ncbi:Uncharacterised protein [uncultured archaeon]|nr:Uncharacterised protein [uncultured archaeon]